MELCDYEDPDKIKYCPPAIPPMLIQKEGEFDMGPQMDPALLALCLDMPFAPECLNLGQSGAVTRSPSTFINDMPSGVRPGTFEVDDHDCYGNMVCTELVPCLCFFESLSVS